MATVGYVLGDVPEVFFPRNAMLDGDEEIGVNDINKIVSIILTGAPTFVPENARHALDNLFVKGNDICLNSKDVYTGCEMTISLPNGCQLKGAKAANGVKVMTNKLENGNYRLVAFSEDARQINSSEVLISLNVSGSNEGNISLTDVRFTNPIHETVVFASVNGEATGIEDVTLEQSNMPTYNLQGVKMDGKNLPRGLYIINGKKYKQVE
jgi:hypothetical protein